MELLPAGYAEFRERAYWNRFFKCLEDDAFEWYGSYKDLKHVLYEAVNNRLKYVEGSVEKKEDNYENGNQDVSLVGTCNGTCYDTYMNRDTINGDENGENRKLNKDISVVRKNESKKKRRDKCEEMKRNDKDDKLKLNKNCLLINIGCGNSEMSNDLYEDGFSDIVNLDYSEVVINKMTRVYGEKMKFIQIDIRKQNEFCRLMNDLEKEKEEKKKDYKIILDKAFLDAYLSTDSNEDVRMCIKNAKNYFTTVFEHLMWGDIFFIVTLAQPQILIQIMANVAVQKNVHVDVYSIQLKKETEKYTYQPFVFVISRSKTTDIQKSANIIFFSNKEKIVKPTTLSKIVKEVKEIQLQMPYRIFQKGQRIILDVINTEINKCTFHIILYDSYVETEEYKTVVIIIPPGYEFHYLYASTKGNEQLAQLAKTKRLLLVMKSKFAEEEKGNEGVKEREKEKEKEKVNEKKEEKREGKKAEKEEGNDKKREMKCAGEEENEEISRKTEEEITNRYVDNEFDRINMNNELYENKNAVKQLLDETKHFLSNTLKDLAFGYSDDFPIMLLNENIKNCKTVCRKKSLYANDIIVRDVLITEDFLNEHFENTGTEIETAQKRKTQEKQKLENNKDINEVFNLIKARKEEKKLYFRNKDIYYRQLIFSCDPFTVQSEVVYTVVKAAEEKENGKLTEDQIHFEYVESASKYHFLFCCSLYFLINETFPNDTLIRMCILGGGTNVFSNIIRRVFSNFCFLFDIVELDEVVHKLSALFSNELSHVENHKTNYFIEDAYEYIKRYDKTKVLYDFIFVDINNSENCFLINPTNGEKLYIVCPHRKFIHQEVLHDVKKMLNEKGLLVINLLTRDEKARTYVYRFLKKEFPFVVSLSGGCKEENNEVIVCRSEIGTAKVVKEFKNNVINMVIKNNSWFLNFDLEDFLKNVNIL